MAPSPPAAGGKAGAAKGAAKPGGNGPAAGAAAGKTSKQAPSGSVGASEAAAAAAGAGVDEVAAQHAGAEAASVKANLKFSNPAKVPCSVNFSVRPRGAALSPGQRFPMEVHPSGLIIPPNESRWEGCHHGQGVCGQHSTLAKGRRHLHRNGKCPIDW